MKLLKMSYIVPTLFLSCALINTSSKATDAPEWGDKKGEHQLYRNIQLTLKEDPYIEGYFTPTQNLEFLNKYHQRQTDFFDKKLDKKSTYFSDTLGFIESNSRHSLTKKLNASSTALHGALVNYMAYGPYSNKSSENMERSYKALANFYQKRTEFNEICHEISNHVPDFSKEIIGKIANIQFTEEMEKYNKEHPEKPDFKDIYKKLQSKLNGKIITLSDIVQAEKTYKEDLNHWKNALYYWNMTNGTTKALTQEHVGIPAPSFANYLSKLIK